MNRGLHLITGGVRSGKSAFAEKLVHDYGGDDVTYIATLAEGDTEMARRIAKHRERRPADWRTIEAPLDAVSAIRSATGKAILFDCVSGLISNHVIANEAHGEQACLDRCRGVVDLMLAESVTVPRPIVFVTNEVGLGVVPPYALGRWFRDALGLANQRIARQAESVTLMTAGIPLFIKGRPEIDLLGRT